MSLRSVTTPSLVAVFQKTSHEILGFELEADAKRCNHPDRYEDEDGHSMWMTLMGLLEMSEVNPITRDDKCARTESLVAVS